MEKKKSSTEIVPSGNNELFCKIINSPAFANFGQKVGDEITLKRGNGDAISVKRNKKCTVAKASMNGEKKYKTLYDTGTEVGGYSKKKK